MANYDTVKAGIEARLKGLALTPSSDATDFANASVNEYDNRFILKALSGANQENVITDRFYDAQEWQIMIAIARSEHNDIINLDRAHRKKDEIIKDLDKPTNWSSFVKMLKYDRWEVIENPNYFVIDIRLLITDLFIHT